MTKQSRWKSKVMWVAAAGQVISLLQLTGVFARMGIDVGIAGNVVAGFIQLLVIVGFLNDPTNPNGF
ncbi:phage holin [Ruminiclostridium josui]|uniref:phage holin n=1 Tax=Ruminiclostridium josui TaxID=1499 RepID=UPI000465A17B|nr:phage holin [Ruminiclostridium josui]